MPSSISPTSPATASNSPARPPTRPDAEYVVFCGVHFMAESADILTRPEVRVILPDLGAGCSMADMANLDQTLECWEQLQQTCPDQRIVPITYMNSSAAIKAFVGEHGGAVCTSSQLPQCPGMGVEEGRAQSQAIRHEPVFSPGPARRTQSRKSSSSPTNTSAATPPTPWAIRSTKWSSGTRAKTSAATPSAICTTPTSSSGKATAPSTSSSAPSMSTRCARNTPT